MKRQRGRGRNNNKNHGNRQMDSSGPDVKVRGSATQVHDKYVALARDAASSGNRVKAENLRQHAEHYLRVMNAQEEAKQAAREEAEAARAERGDNNNDDDSNNNRENNKGRRYPPRIRNKSTEENTDQEAQKTNKSDNSGLDVIEPQLDIESDASDAQSEKPKRRRRAPTRKKAETETVDAAE